MDYCDIEWFALGTNRDHSVVFEIASKYCISDSFVDYDGVAERSTPRPRSGAAAKRSYPMIRGGGCTLLKQP